MDDHQIVIAAMSAPALPEDSTTPFMRSYLAYATAVQMPLCTTRYHVVRVEADPSADVEINCLVCDQPLRSRDGQFILKYFLLDGQRRQTPKHPAHIVARNAAS